MAQEPNSAELCAVVLWCVTPCEQGEQFNYDSYLKNRQSQSPKAPLEEAQIHFQLNKKVTGEVRAQGAQRSLAAPSPAVSKGRLDLL